MTLDDQLSALAPLDSGAIARLAEYANGPGQLREYRHKGRSIPPERLRMIARRLRALADAADRIAGPLEP